MEGRSSPRNRYVDFLRAAAITVVVLGHWLMAAPTVERRQFTLSDMLHVSPWTQWLTWGFQVMPVFFLVGGWV
ncbi:MAG: acyltransferase family protein, partial [Gemmatimonadota bacterium]